MIWNKLPLPTTHIWAFFILLKIHIVKFCAGKAVISGVFDHVVLKLSSSAVKHENLAYALGLGNLLGCSDDLIERHGGTVAMVGPRDLGVTGRACQSDLRHNSPGIILIEAAQYDHAMRTSLRQRIVRVEPADFDHIRRLQGL